MRINVPRWTLATLGVFAFASSTAADLGAPGCEADWSVTSREIEIDNGPGRLGGMLIAPVTRGVHPAMLYLYGSSVVARDGRGLFPPIWCVLAHAGVVSVAWDRPGVGRSTGNAAELDWRGGDRAREAQSVLAFVRRQAEVDPSNVGLLGISQAGWIIPQVLAMDGAIRRIVLLSTPVSTVWDQTRYVIDRHMLDRGLGGAARREALGDLHAIENVLRGRETYAAYVRFVPRLQHRTWLPVVRELPQGDYFNLSRTDFESERRDAQNDLAPDFSNLQIPLLAVYGTADENVDPKMGIQTFERLRRSHTNVTLIALPGVNHFMRRVEDMPVSTRPAATPAANDLKVTQVAPELLSVIAGWVRFTE